MRELNLILTIFLFAITLQMFGQGGKQGESYLFDINNITLPIDNRGVLADVDINGIKGGFFYGEDFLFSGGIFLTGYNLDTLWGNGQASASLVLNYEPGPVGGSFDSNTVIYVIDQDDPPFGDSWNDWIDAVELGADFYDGNNDGDYNPVDLNSNGSWDSDEDAPYMPGKRLAFCVYNDSQPIADRSRFAGVNPQGIEICQYIYAPAESNGEYNNVLRIEYRIRNKNMEQHDLTDIIFGVWADPDLGNEYDDDLTGCDRRYSAGYVYQRQYDNPYLCCMISVMNTENPLTDFSSFMHYQQSDPDLGDPETHNELRYYNVGLNKQGEEIDPCDWPLGNEPPGCDTINNKFWYSGDPVTDLGWLNTISTDQRIMLNIGPFDLAYGEEKKITATYIMGSSTGIWHEAITKARETAEHLFGPTTGLSIDNTTIPEGYFLEQNYPNPFNPETKIKFSIPVKGNVNLKVTNILGETIAVLVNETLEAGIYTADFNASSLASGAYFYILSTSESVLTKKMMLVK